MYVNKNNKQQQQIGIQQTTTGMQQRGYKDTPNNNNKHNTLQPNCLTKILNQSTSEKVNFTELFDKNTNRGQGQGANRLQGQWSNMLGMCYILCMCVCGRVRYDNCVWRSLVLVLCLCRVRRALS
jgi:hypothetical protein